MLSLVSGTQDVKTTVCTWAVDSGKRSESLKKPG